MEGVGHGFSAFLIGQGLVVFVSAQDECRYIYVFFIIFIVLRYYMACDAMGGAGECQGFLVLMRDIIWFMAVLFCFADVICS
jgi:hypothetical protein